MGTRARDIRRARKLGGRDPCGPVPFTSPGMRRAFFAGQRDDFRKRRDVVRALDMAGAVGETIGLPRRAGRMIAATLLQTIGRAMDLKGGPEMEAAGEVMRRDMAETAYELGRLAVGGSPPREDPPDAPKEASEKGMELAKRTNERAKKLLQRARGGSRKVTL